MDIRRLHSFIVIADTGSITKAADILHVAQPALSQQLAALEDYFQQKLLTRSQQGVKLTDAGRAVYRHAQTILRQMECAKADAFAAGGELVGHVSVGLIPFSGATTLSLELLRQTRQRHPAILLNIKESVGQAYSQMILNGVLEIALLHGVGPIKGVDFTPLREEEFWLVHNGSFNFEVREGVVSVGALDGLPMLLPPVYNFVRKAVETSFIRSRVNLNLVAEIDAVRTLIQAIDHGLGLSIMPRAVVDRIIAEAQSPIIAHKITPRIKETLSICTPAHSPLSEAAGAVRTILLELSNQL